MAMQLNLRTRSSASGRPVARSLTFAGLKGRFSPLRSSLTSQGIVAENPMCAIALARTRRVIAPWMPSVVTWAGARRLRRCTVDAKHAHPANESLHGLNRRNPAP